MTTPVQCRQCGEPVPHDREGWDSPMCYGCLPPIGTKRASAFMSLMRAAMVAILSTPTEEPTP